MNHRTVPFLIALILSCCLCAAAERMAWTTSRVHGSPEPPLPFQTVNAFPKLKFNQPVAMEFIPGGDRAIVAEQSGKLFSFSIDGQATQADLLIDLRAQVKTVSRHPGARGVADCYAVTLHPQFQQNHFLYVCYTLAPKVGTKVFQEGTRISRFTLSDTNPPKCDPATEEIFVDWPAGGHNGCDLHFGPDGMLYFSAGDAADPNPPDTYNTGQDLSDLLSSILRIDVDHRDPGKNYAIPRDNPFIRLEGARPEIWSYGLRNPWRFSFDRATGQLWCGDVGWELWEMVHLIQRGGNSGWSITEGPQPVHSEGKRGPTPVIPPALVLPHSESASITGGVVYRGKKYPQLVGHYVFGDWETRRLWASKVNGPKLEPYRTIAQTDLRIVGFAEDAQGELYIVDYESGGIYSLIPGESGEKTAAFPRKLSETGLFASLREQTPADGVVPFHVNAAQWVDGGIAERYIGVPSIEAARVSEGWRKIMPRETVLVRTFSLPLDAAHPQQLTKIETQLLHFNGKQWNGYTYEWDDQQSDATLVDAGGKDRPLQVSDSAAPGGKREQTWHYASRAQCMTCHTSWTDYLLAFNEAQLSPQETDLFRDLRLLPTREPNKTNNFRLTDPYQESGDLALRARSYLHVNCSTCHRMGGGGSALIDVRADLPLKNTGLIDAPAMLGAFGLDDPKIVHSGDPARSVLFYRMAKVGRGRMPHIGSDLVDDRGLKVIAQWIMSLAPESADAHAKQLAALRNVSPEAIDQALSTSTSALQSVATMEVDGLPDNARKALTERGAASSQEAVRDLFERFAPTDPEHRRLGNHFNPEVILSLSGDAARGRSIFFDLGGGLCRQCHKVNGQGEDFGPDLTGIGKKFSRDQILENILQPSKTIDPKFITYVIKTKKNDDFVGLMVERTEKEIVLKDAQRNTMRIPIDQVKKLTPQTISSMPEALLSGLTPQQAADLIAFLQSLK